MRLIFSFGLIFLSPLAFAQTAKDYFFPQPDKNLSVYKTIKSKGTVENGWITKVYFKNKGDSALITTQSDGVARRNGNAIDANQVWEQLVKITDKEILTSRVKARTPNGVETFESEGDIVFRIPQGSSKKTEWENSGQKGTMIETHLSEFSKVRVNGKRIKAIKVTTFLKRKRTGKRENFYVDYYVEGIGRYKRTTPRKNMVIEILADQKYDPNPPIVR